MSNQNTVSDSVVFYVYCFQSMEKMTACFYGRINRLCTLAILVFIFTLIAHIVSPPLVGLAIIFIVGYQFSYSPGDIASRADQQAFRYSQVIHDIHRMTEEEVREKLKSLEPKDSKILLSISKASYIQAGVATGNVKTAAEKFEKLNWIERFIIFIAGGIHK